ncbi:MAG: hydrogenase iron-sulfur subunit [Dehalococcoidia bacterium]|nr:hydrogenase iron-sulfur subunit [Dehalococcoidia bacterium]
MVKEGFEPRIIVFACNWCSYSASDVAGTSRMRYPANVRVIRVMCSGMVDFTYVLKALEDGADGVLVAGCHIGDCHYTSGNVRAEKMIARLKTLLHRLGLEDDRLRLEWIGAGEGQKFAKTMEEMVNRIKELGPSPLREGKIEHAKKAPVNA